jgi:hypothetical protein
VSFHFIHPNHKVFKEAIMAKKVIRLGILLVLVASFMLYPISATPAHAVAVGRDVQVLIFNVQWDGNTSGDAYSSPDAVSVNWTKDPKTTIGEMRAMIEGITGYPVLILALVNDNGGCGFSTDFVISTTDSAPISNYEICKDDPENLTILLVYKTHPKEEVTRLTLYGYSLGDGKSCVLWSLDGNPNGNPTKKCGAEAELVCKVRLVEKDLKYDCKDGYDWLGFQIAHDPQWLSWADKFARQHDR